MPLTRLIAAACVSAAVLLAGCGTEPKASLAWEPPIVPITFSVDTTGHIEVKVEKQLRVVTQVGTFTVSGQLSKDLTPSKDGMRVIIRTGPEGAQQDTVYLVKTHRALRFALNGSFIEEISQDSVLVTVKAGSAAQLTIRDAHPEQASAQPSPPAQTCRKDAEHTVTVPRIAAGRGGDSLAAVVGKLRAICVRPDVQSWPSTERAGTVVQVWLPTYKPFSTVSYPPFPTDTGAPKPGDRVVIHSFYPATILVSTGHGLG